MSENGKKIENDPHKKVIGDQDLYNVTKQEIKELKNMICDPLDIKALREILPVFYDIQKEKKEAAGWNKKIIIRHAEMNDFKGIINLRKRVLRSGTLGMPLIDKPWVEYRLHNGVIFVATTKSNLIVGLVSFLLNNFHSKSGYWCIIMVSQSFKGKRIGSRLFDTIADWAEKEGLTHFSSNSLTNEGFEFVKYLEKTRKHIGFKYRRDYGAFFIINSNYNNCEIHEIDLNP
jgi:GNAT superfamily N-acetyltransferase